MAANFGSWMEQVCTMTIFDRSWWEAKLVQDASLIAEWSRVRLFQQNTKQAEVKEVK